jgi:hypothetical protein
MPGKKEPLCEQRTAFELCRLAWPADSKFREETYHTGVCTGNRNAQRSPSWIAYLAGVTRNDRQLARLGLGAQITVAAHLDI